MQRRLRKKNFIIGGALAVIVIAGFIVSTLIQEANQKTNQAILQDTGYTTILPSGKSIVDLGGWERVSPEGTDPVYAFSDKLSGVVISVSEQPLPSTFKGSVNNSIATLAQSYNATATTQLGDATIYIGTSAKGPQSVIFTKSGLLILIKSEQKIENTTWSSYAASLQ